MVGNVATAYAITYIFGLAGLIAAIELLPHVLGTETAKTVIINKKPVGRSL